VALTRFSSVGPNGAKGNRIRSPTCTGNFVAFNSALPALLASNSGVISAIATTFSTLMTDADTFAAVVAIFSVTKADADSKNVATVDVPASVSLAVANDKVIVADTGTFDLAENITAAEVVAAAANLSVATASSVAAAAAATSV
jgi:hypothetical protein